MSFYPHTFASATETLGSRESRKLKNNTYLIRRSPDAIAVKLHATDVITYHADGTVTFRSGGYESVTTKDRLNNFGPDNIRTYSDRGTWKMYDYGAPRDQRESSAVIFFDGITFNPADLVGSTMQYRSAAEESTRVREAWKKEIGSFLRKLTAERLATLVADARESGTAGDCFFCVFDAQLIERDGRKASCLTSPVDTTEDYDGIPSDHVLSHVREDYWHLTLILCALRWAGYRDFQLPVVIGHHDIVKRAARRYLMSRISRIEVPRTADVS